MRPLPLSNPPNPWSSTTVEWLGEPPNAPLTVYEEKAKSILNEIESPDVGMRWSLNAYRGCQHACAYCYARPTHQYWGFGAGTDFDRNIVVKVNAPELLREAFEKRGWSGETVSFSGNTDCYKPLEASYQLTRRCLEVCLEYRNPAHVISKSALVRRDIGLLADLGRRARVGVTISIPFADDAAFPERSGKVRRAILDMRGGKMNEAEFGARMEGKGPRWDAIATLFELTAKRLGLATSPLPEMVNPATTFRRPKAQQELF